MLHSVQKEKYACLLEGLRGMERVLVAFSGGVDSTFLLHAAIEALSGGVFAVTFAAPYTPCEEVEGAKTMAQAFGVRHHVVELGMPEELRNNPPERCYLCKKIFLGTLVDIARKSAIIHVLDGSNVDDLQDYRPGGRALRELGVKSPLLDAGLTKQDIRDISRYYTLSTWDRPAGSCLLTRLPHDTAVTERELARIEAGERFLRSVGFPTVRLRSHGDLARIEIPHTSLVALLEAEAIYGVDDQLKALGYRHVTLDLGGYCMGSLNKPNA